MTWTSDALAGLLQVAPFRVRVAATFAVALPGVATASVRIHKLPCTIAFAATDSAGAAIRSVSIAVADAANNFALTVLTDSAGRGIARLVPGTYTVVARRIGYRPATREIRTTCSAGDRRFSIQLAELPPTLATVHVRAQEDIRHRRLFIDADAIAHSSRRLDDALDIIAKLRPDMVYGLGGKGFCAPANNIWVNGRRIPWQLVSINLIAASRDPGLGLPSWIKSVLASINPEHIAQITYLDCMDHSIGKLGSDRAIFVVLKPGIEFDPGTGSHPIGQP